MKQVTAKLLLPLSLLLLTFVVLIEFYWMPSAFHAEIGKREQELSRTIFVLGELVGNDPEKATALIDRFNNDPQHWYTLKLHAAERAPKPASSVELVEGAVLHLPVGQNQVLTGWLNVETICDETRGRYRELEFIVLALMVCTFLLLVGMQQHMLIRPIKHLVQAARRGAQGDLDFNIPNEHQTSFLSPVIDAFNDMRVALSRQRSALETQVHERALAESRLRESHMIAQLGAWEWFVERDYFWCSASLRALLMPSLPVPEKLEQFFAHVHPADQTLVRKKFRKLIEAGLAENIEFRISTDTGGYRHIQMMSRAESDETGALIKVSGTCQDITERKNIEGSLQKLSSAITHSGSSVIIVDILGAIEYVNPKFIETTGFSMDELVGKQPELLSRKLIAADQYEALWQSILSGRHWRGELKNLRKDGSAFWSLVSISPLHNEYSELTHFVIVSEDVTELKDAHARMEKLALYDELTELPNRRLFFRELGNLFRQELLPYPAVVMLLDLDYFKAVNDTQGHSAGDQLLIQVARRLKDTLRDEDMAARLGGDEFAILLNPVEDAEQVDIIAKKILDAISRPFMISGSEVQISTSLGLAWLPKDGQTPEALLKHADLAMYQAKEMGRNQYRFFTESLHQQLKTYVQFSREMPKALEGNEFRLFYQPQVDLDTGDIFGFEALIRWEHPELGMIAPAEFISIAEETGFIIPLGRWIMETACEMLKWLSEQGLGHLRLAVNLSSRQFRDSNLLSSIRDAMDQHDIEPSRLEVEITESLLMQDILQAIDILQELQALGVTIAIDDFGIGYSSFSYLKTLPVNVIKVDREFIKDIPEHIDDMEITAAIISMAHRLRMKVVAEGVETETQKQFLKEQGCDIGQGYLYSRPVPQSQILSMINSIKESQT